MKETKAQDLSIDRFLRTSEVLVVPDYQRRYSWGKRQLNDFWQDLVELKERQTHFFGSILVITHHHTLGDYNIQEIVDGQQRLATISILLSIFSDYFGKNGKIDLAKDIENHYLYSKKPGKSQRQKLELGDLDSESYLKIINADKNGIPSKKLFDAYDFFAKKIKVHDDPEGIFHKLVDQMIIVLIETFSDLNAFRLFETLNDRGLPLTPADKIKNHLLRVASERTDKTAKNVKKLWSQTLRNLTGLGIVPFFRRYLMSAGSPDVVVVGKIADTGLYDRIKQILADGFDIEELAKDMQDQSKLYKKICGHSIDLYSDPRNVEINNHLANILAIRAATSYTLLLRAFRKIQEPRDITRILEIIEIFALRRIICRWSTANLDTIYNHLALNAFKKLDPVAYITRYLQDRMPKDPEFEASFSGSNRFRNNNQTRYILSKIEEEHFGHGGKKIGNPYKVHIEHIMPSGVFSYKKYKAWRRKIKDEETHDKFKSRVGNLTLLESRPNIQASNKPFKEKKKHYTADKTDMMMTHGLLEYDDWGVKEIEERSVKMAKIATTIWSF